MRTRNSIAFGILLMLAAGSSAVIRGASVSTVSSACPGGYRVHSVTLDPVLHRQWAWIEDCVHPERPLEVIAMPARQDSSATSHIGAMIPSDLNLASTFPNAAHRTTRIDTASIGDIPRSVLREIHSAPVATTPQPTFANQDPRSPLPPQTPLIRAGERVHLWSSEANVRLEIEVIALEYGRAGQVIHFRRKDQPTELTGVVMGRDIAELMP